MIKRVLSRIDIKRKLQIIRIIVWWRPLGIKPVENKETLFWYDTNNHYK